MPRSAKALPRKTLIGGEPYVRDDFGAYVPAKPPVERILVKEPADCLPALLPYRNAPTERLLVITLDGSGRIIRVHEVTRGLVDRAVVHPREVFQKAVEDLAVGIIVAHNHPSGSLEVSAADLVTTRRLVEASKVLGIKVEDHLIFTRKGFVSSRARYPEYFSKNALGNG